MAITKQPEIVFDAAYVIAFPLTEALFDRSTWPENDDVLAWQDSNNAWDVIHGIMNEKMKVIEEAVKAAGGRIIRSESEALWTSPDPTTPEDLEPPRAR